MVQAGQVTGVVEVINKTTGHFNDQDVILLREVADLLADYV